MKNDGDHTIFYSLTSFLFMNVYITHKKDGDQTIFYTINDGYQTILYNLIPFIFLWNSLNLLITYKIVLNDGNQTIIIVWYLSLFTSGSLIVHSSFIDCKHSWFIMQNSLNVQSSFINCKSCWLIEWIAGCKNCLFNVRTSFTYCMFAYSLC